MALKTFTKFLIALNTVFFALNLSHIYSSGGEWLTIVGAVCSLIGMLGFYMSLRMGRANV